MIVYTPYPTNYQSNFPVFSENTEMVAMKVQAYKKCQ